MLHEIRLCATRPAKRRKCETSNTKQNGMRASDCEACNVRNLKWSFEAWLFQISSVLRLFVCGWSVMMMAFVLVWFLIWGKLSRFGETFIWDLGHSTAMASK